MILRCCVSVSVIRRSSGFFGRMAIRFSCCDSHPMDVHEQIAVALDAEAGVGGEVRIADDRHTRFRFRRLGIGRLRLAARASQPMLTPPMRPPQS